MPPKNEPVPLLSGLSDIADNYSHFVIDLWGVIHNGVELSPHARATLERMTAEGKKWVFVDTIMLSVYLLLTPCSQYVLQ